MAKLNLLLLAVLAAAAAGVLASCSVATVRVPERVSVEVPVPCARAQDVPARPPLRSEADLMGMDRYRRTLVVWADWLKLQVYAAELEAIVEGCARLPP